MASIINKDTEKDKTPEIGDFSDINVSDLPFSEIAEQSKKEYKSKHYDLAEKYRSMKKNRQKYNTVSIDNFLPSIYDMIKEDCVIDILDDVASSINNDNDETLDVAYYSSEPFTTEPGYYSDKKVFVLDVKDIAKSNGVWSLNKYDGDTLSFYLDDLDSNGSFNFNGSNYSSYQDYVKKQCLDSADNSGRSKITLRFAGIDSAEIPHYEVVLRYKDNKLKEYTIKELKNMKSSGKDCRFQSFNVNRNDSSDVNKWTVEDRKDSHVVKVYVKDNIYYEVRENIDAKQFAPSNYDSNLYTPITIVAQNEATKDKVLDGYKAQYRLKNLFTSNKIKDLKLVLDANTQSYKKTYPTYTIYATLYRFGENVENLIKTWIDAVNGINAPLTRLNYYPFGTDIYGRVIGTLYANVDTGSDTIWIDLSKYVLAGTDLTIANPDFSGSEELKNVGDGFSDAINIGSYQQNSTRYVDNLDISGVESYNKKIELHKQLTGIDFTQMKDCTVMIGDSLFLIPPQSIRNVNSIDYERVPVMRGKGTMTKNKANREQLIEIDLFFYGNSGINGIPYEAELPNGNTITYYMNGLRAMLSQFRLCPFLPIENSYINNVLGIETVALVNFALSTVDGFPKLLKATLTLRDFNYRVYMPDLPISYYGDEENLNALGDGITEQIFGKTFEWELYRYYYQRAIINGEELNKEDFSSFAYAKKFYSCKNAFQPSDLTDNFMEFYIPDEEWLKGALQYKKAIDYTGQIVSDLSLGVSDNEWLKEVASLQEQLDTVNDDLETFNKALIDAGAGAYIVGSDKKYVSKDIFSKDGLTCINIKNKDNFKSGKELLQKHIHTNICNKLVKNPIVKRTNTTESYKGDGVIQWSINIVLDTSSCYEKDTIREVVKTLCGAANAKDCLVNDTVQLNITANFDMDKKTEGYSKDSLSYSVSDDLSGIIKAYYNNSDDDANLAGVNEDMFDFTKYKEPACMKFVPYLTDENGNSKKLDVDEIGFSMSNTFTEMYLKSCDGYAPQFMGGSDVVVEAKFTLTEQDVIYDLNRLPAIITQFTKDYRRIMPCYPLRIKNSYLQTLGLNEMLLDSIQVETIDGFPGAYEVRIRMTSVDRSLRQREALKKLDSLSYTTTIDESSIVNLFALQDQLAKAELYPDLDLPTIDELEKCGWKYLKYINQKRLFVDPDFYIIYSFKYTAQLIKEILYKYIYKDYLQDEDGLKSLTDSSYVLEDTMGMKMNARFDNILGSTFENANDYAELYDVAIEDITEQSENEELKKKIGKDKYIEYKDISEIGSIIEYATATGLGDGWQIREGWNAVLSDEATNGGVEKLTVSGIDNSEDVEDEEKDNKIYEEIYNMRAKAIHLIDNILETELTYTTDDMEEQDILEACGKAVENIFVNNKDGKELLKLLNGGQSPNNYLYDGVKKDFGKNYKSESADFSTYNSDKPHILFYIQSFLYSAAFAFSPSSKERKDDIGLPFVQDHVSNFLSNFISGTTGFTDSFNMNSSLRDDINNDDTDTKTDNSDNGIDNSNIEGETNKIYSPIHYDDDGNPRIKVKDTNLKESSIKKKGSSWDTVMKNVDEAKGGGTFGMYSISTYSIDKLKTMLSPDEIVKYKYDDEDVNKMYPKEDENVFAQNNAFIDPYYNKAGHRSEKGKKYKEYIIKYPTSSAEAFLRIVLLFLKRMIIEGYFFTELDVIQGDYDTVKDKIKEIFKLVDNSDSTHQDHGDNINVSTSGGTLTKEDFKDAFGVDVEELDELLDELPDIYKKIYCARMIYPFVAAITEYDDSIIKYIRNRDYDTLNTFSASVTGNSNLNDKDIFNRFLSSLKNTKTISFDNEVTGSKETTTASQKINNLLMQEAFTACSDDPRQYVLHSFYDMVKNDKRGRLLRAFPTYYVVFIDEGRKIGSWKLFDNFYNMSSISELQVVKSRKIPADTCTFTMSNMYMSYAQTYDNSIYQQYVDVYGVKDLVDSIFSPMEYLKKEDMIKKRKQLKDTTVLSPGVRIHVRMGYGSDASAIPIVFNGKIAEIEVGDVVEVVCQGDGHELCNPLNALGEISAKSFKTSQHYITWFKDIRGSFMRGGESPRNLAAKLLNAEYSGVIKRGLRDVSNHRYFADNPFGIYHFGDKRFQDIFLEGETVQNLYEVSNDTLLSDYNTLINDKTTNASTSTINCSLQDKTYWEILNLCANSGDGYYAAIRDFGFRSTVCLCKANHYYAYDYRKVNGVIYEKRKPFQQFHYYDSYNDIVYNTIKASEKNMKTNAVGTWQSTDYIWGTSQDTVGPIFLDMNIYPEYQKSMTVDTGLIGGGNGGLNLGITTHLGEKWTSSAEDDKVNKSLAEKVTTNVLRNSVKDMYEGELCIIGDPSIKPFDSMCFSDVYEDMQGTVEVETVIHNFNSSTGFTTAVVPDIITCTESIEQRVGAKKVLGKFLVGAGALTSKFAISRYLDKLPSYLTKFPASGKIGAAKAFIESVTKITIPLAAEGSGAATVLKGFSSINPVSAAITIIGTAATYIFTQNLKDTIYRTLKNIQAITVFPITKNQRPLVAGMAGHKGSVYGFPYTSDMEKDSIQHMIMSFYEDAPFVKGIANTIISDYDIQGVFENWRTSLPVGENAELFSDSNSEEENKSIFVNEVYGAISKELSGRAAYIQALKTKPRIKIFYTSNKTSEEYLMYQIGGLYEEDVDKEEYKSLSKEDKEYVTQEKLSTNKKLTSLSVVEDDDEIKLAINKNHPVIREFTFSHSASAIECDLVRESGNRKVKYIVDSRHLDGGSKDIFDFPLLQEDAMAVLKTIINCSELANTKINFSSGTRVNDIRSWKSTGFSFSLSCNNEEALKKAVKSVKEDTKWYNSSEVRYCFDYDVNADQGNVLITVYAPAKE